METKFNIYSANYNAKALAECLLVASYAETDSAKAYHMTRAKIFFAKVCEDMGKAE